MLWRFGTDDIPASKNNRNPHRWVEKVLTVGGLFSGIGGWELGLQRAGMRVLWHCEADPYARGILERHWPGVPCYEDVRGLTGGNVQPVDVLCGGFPCQDISDAGPRTGIDGARSGLWSEYARLVGELRPRYVCVENVAALLGRGLGRVLGDLAALGYDAEWDCIPASALGAPHQRDRLWLVAYPASERRGPRRQGRPPASDPGEPEPERPLQVPDAPGAGLEGREQPAAARRLRPDAASGDRQEIRPWADEPGVPRVVDGLPDWVDRMRVTGNALVPQIPEWIGRRILEYESSVN